VTCCALLPRFLCADVTFNPPLGHRSLSARKTVVETLAGDKGILL